MKDDGLLTTVPRFSINDRFTMIKELALYSLTIELIIPIDYILLQVLPIVLAAYWFRVTL